MVNLELRLDGETVAKLEIDATQLSRLLPSTMHVPMVHPERALELANDQGAGSAAAFARRH